ncbi:MAG: hypothetical protein GX962_00345 [Epulopiscium sp.]|nr:hypothetical protein [Candidatus Epulonipiscium sp.]
MKRRHKMVIGLMIFFIAGILFFPLEWVHGTGVEPGTQGDPLVSKSYVDKRINEILSLVQGKPVTGNPSDGAGNIDIDDLLEQVDLMIQFRMKEAGITAPSYETVEVKKGQQIVGNQGTEMILRSGKAKAMASTSGGLQNVTAGADIAQDQQIPQYHLIIIPRSDGRGFEMTADGWLMIRGEYQVQK